MVRSRCEIMQQGFARAKFVWSRAPHIHTESRYNLLSGCPPAPISQQWWADHEYTYIYIYNITLSSCVCLLSRDPIDNLHVSKSTLTIYTEHHAYSLVLRRFVPEKKKTPSIPTLTDAELSNQLDREWLEPHLIITKLNMITIKRRHRHLITHRQK